MSAPMPTTTGVAFRVTIFGAQQAEAYQNVHVLLDDRRGVVHLFAADGRTHYLTIPLGSALIEWKDPSELDPRPRVPPFGLGAYQGFAEHVQRMAKDMGGFPAE